MGARFTKNINQDFFKKWTSEMAYVLGYIVADGCIVVSKDRKKNPFSLNITSVEKKHLYRIRKALESGHKISKKTGGKIGNAAYQFQTRNPVVTKDLMKLGVFPRKTYNLGPINIPVKFSRDFVRGFFDGDGTVYIYIVNGTLQIKAGFCNPSLSFLTDLNKRLCTNLKIPLKSIHADTAGKRRMPLYYINFYIDDCEKLYQFMYGHNPCLHLPRKRKIFEKWKSIKRRHYIKQNYPSKIGWRLNQRVYT